MKSSHNTFGFRIVLSALIIAIVMISITAYSTYREDIRQEIGEKIVEALPDMDHALAKL